MNEDSDKTMQNRVAGTSRTGRRVAGAVVVVAVVLLCALIFIVKNSSSGGGQGDDQNAGMDFLANAGDMVVALSDGVVLEIVKIKAGRFTMGSPTTEQGREDDETPHRVTLTKDFWLGKYEVTQGQWEAIMGTTLIEQADKVNNGEGKKIVGNIHKDYPMYYVNWEEAMAFCRKLTSLERKAGRLSNGYIYTLPTEAQWEYACRAGTQTALYNGDIQIVGATNAPALDPIAWYGGNSSVNYVGDGWETEGWKEKQYPGGMAGPRKVGEKKPNDWGLYDMIGNVWEWCYNLQEDYPSHAVKDPVGPSSGTLRVLRGGGWSDSAKRCRAAAHDSDVPTNRSRCFGFRVALVPVQ